MIIGSEYIYIKNLPSTNSYAAELLKKEIVKEGTIVYTSFQTEGRGQTGNSWESEAGKNLLFSLIIYPVKVSPQNQFIISKAVSLGICDYLQEYTAGVSIKWPNDIYVNNDKIAGILIESSIIGNEIKSMIVGTGLNINQKIFKSDAPNPVSLSFLTGADYDLEKCLENLVKYLNLRYKQLLKNGVAKINSEYLGKLYRAGQWFTYRNSEGLFEGKIISVTDEGRLKIEDRSSRITDYGYKEVEYILD